MLPRIKAIIKFLRIWTYREELIELGEASDFDCSFMKATPPNTASWRWDTFHVALEWLRPCYIVFDSVWGSEVFKKAKARKLEIVARDAVTDPVCRRRLAVAFDMSHIVHVIRHWGSGCPCHEEDRKAGRVVSCDQQGKRLPEIPARLSTFFDDNGARRDAPQVGDMCHECELPLDEEEARSYGFQDLLAISETSMKWVDEQPLSLAKINSVDDLALARAEYFALPVQRRHRRVRRLFEGAV